MKYKVGDRVKVREDLVEGRHYGKTSDDALWYNEMADTAGKTVTIAEVDEGRATYRVKECEWWTWTDEMFDGLADEPTESPTTSDAVSHPSHYNVGKIEVIDFIEDKKLNFSLGNAVKYIARCQHKVGGTKRIEDLKKAIWYIQHQIDVWKGETA